MEKKIVEFVRDSNLCKLIDEQSKKRSTMSLNDFNLIWLSVDGHDIFQPISECEINGRVYKCDFSEVDEEKVYIPENEVRRGFIMNIRSQKKIYFVRALGFVSVYIWELPHKENAEYTFDEAREYVTHNPETVYANVPTEKCSI